MNTVPAVRIEELRKDYHYRGHPIPALAGVTFDVGPGEFVGLFGPNGAGKTTTTKIIVGLLAPDAGTVHIGGIDVVHGSATKHLVGYVPQNGSLLGTLSVLEELTFHARSFGIPRAAADLRARAVADLLDVGDLLDRDVARLSGGQRRRVEIAMGLVHEPRLLVLDEPTLGLDPHTRAGLWDTVRRLRAETGTTILMTTHYLDEASRLMDRIVIMDHGRVVASGTPADIVAGHAFGTVTVTVAGERPVGLAESIGPALRSRWNDVEITATDHQLVLRAGRPDIVLPVVLAELQIRGAVVHAATSTPPTVSDAFFAITGRELVG